MAIRNIVLDGDPILKKVCRPVTKFDDKLGQLIDDMAETMLKADGLGLAAPQVGMLKRIFVALDQYVDEDGNDVDEILEFVNPEIIEKDGAVKMFEGCLSYPGRNGLVTRPKYVKARAQDRYGNWFEIEAEDMLAREICHENDHLNGVTIMETSEVFYEDLTPEQFKELGLEDYE